MVDFAKAKGREIMSEPSPQLNSELLSQLDALMQAREQAARDARRAAWRGLFGSLKKPLLITVWSAAWLGAGFGTRVWMDGGIEIGPGKSDAVSKVFDTQELAFRRLSGERAEALRAGEITSEKASADWMAAKYLPESDAAWATLLTAESAAFGGEQWTADKEAAHIERYAR